MSAVQVRTVPDRLRTRGYWHVAIRPTSFEENHIPNCSDPFPIVEKNSVRLRESAIEPGTAGLVWQAAQ
jgi:hypothetical protein